LIEVISHIAPSHHAVRNVYRRASARSARRFQPTARDIVTLRWESQRSPRCRITRSVMSTQERRHAPRDLPDGEVACGDISHSLPLDALCDKGRCKYVKFSRQQRPYPTSEATACGRVGVFDDHVSRGAPSPGHFCDHRRRRRLTRPSFATAATDPAAEHTDGWPGRSLRRPGDGGPTVAVRASSVRGETFRSCSGASKTPPRPPLCNRRSRASVTRWPEAKPR
jgi:hypothetical protein